MSRISKLLEKKFNKRIKIKENLILNKKMVKNRRRVLEYLDELQSEFDKFFEELVPSEGSCKTKEGELLRAINRILYRYYNDGDVFWRGYGVGTAGPAAKYIHGNAPKNIKDLIKKADGLEDDKYSDAINLIEKEILDYIKSKNGKYEPNNEDMFDKKYKNGAESTWDSSEEEY